MELRKFAKRSGKAQLMTIMMLVIFLLLLAELFSFALINITSSNIAQSLTLSSVSRNYGTILKLSADDFAKQSLAGAVTALESYEIYPNRRQVRFITNTSLELAYLMRNGTLPNDTSTPQSSMANLTLVSYNNSIAQLLGFAAHIVSINQSAPQIFQVNPYHLTVLYTERIVLNVSGNTYKYYIPANATVSLNDTPDLFYAPQGIRRDIRFANITNITAVIGNTPATSGNTALYDYGTVFTVNSVQSSATCPLPPKGGLSQYPINQSLIIVTYDAADLNPVCVNKYGGLITYIANSMNGGTPSVPYLVYPSSSNELNLLPNGTRVLLWGPGLDIINVERLRNAIFNNYYFASPYAPSYLNLVQGNLNTQSPQGIFTFSDYGIQALALPGLNGNYITTNGYPAASALSMSMWFMSTGQVPGHQQYFFDSLPENWKIGFNTVNSLVVYPGSSSAKVSFENKIAYNTWYHVVVTSQNSGSSLLYNVYLNGNNIGSGTLALQNIAAVTNTEIGDFSGNFNGLMANVQLYNKTLTSLQVGTLYQDGISSPPISDNGLIAWWPLNGNANDYSGYNNNGTAVAPVSYNLLLNYSRDSIFAVPSSSALSPFPGFICANTAQCSNAINVNSITQLYLGHMPLELQNSPPQVASFSLTSNTHITATSPKINTVAGDYNTASFWMYWTGGANEKPLTMSGPVSASVDGLWFSGASVCFGFTGGNGDDYGISPLPGLSGNWVSVVAEFYNGAYSGKSSLYINGVKQTLSQCVTGSAQTTTAGISLYIGSSNSLIQGNYFSGNIANLQLYNASLSSNTVNQIYNEGILGLPVSNNALIGWWPLAGDANDYAQGNNGIATSVIYPYLSGNYNSPGLSSISAFSNEWQALGLANT